MDWNAVIAVLMKNAKQQTETAVRLHRQGDRVNAASATAAGTVLAVLALALQEGMK